jgi:hypothetical protein
MSGMGKELRKASETRPSGKLINFFYSDPEYRGDFLLSPNAIPPAQTLVAFMISVVGTVQAWVIAI